MAEQSEQDPKAAKKVAKALAKAAKKEVAARTPDAQPADGLSPAERAAAAAERQVSLQRWRVVLAALAAVIALATFWVMWSRSG